MEITKHSLFHQKQTIPVGEAVNFMKKHTWDQFASI